MSMSSSRLIAKHVKAPKVKNLARLICHLTDDVDGLPPASRAHHKLNESIKIHPSSDTMYSGTREGGHMWIKESVNAALGTKVERPVAHLVLTEDPSNPLTDKQWKKWIERTLKKLGLQDQPFMVFEHYKRRKGYENLPPSRHCHILVSVIGPNHKGIKLSFGGKVLRRVCIEMEDEFYSRPPGANSSASVQKKSFGPSQAVSQQYSRAGIARCVLADPVQKAWANWTDKETFHADLLKAGLEAKPGDRAFMIIRHLDSKVHESIVTLLGNGVTVSDVRLRLTDDSRFVQSTSPEPVRVLKPLSPTPSHHSKASVSEPTVAPPNAMPNATETNYASTGEVNRGEASSSRKFVPLPVMKFVGLGPINLAVIRAEFAARIHAAWKVGDGSHVPIIQEMEAVIKRVSEEREDQFASVAKANQTAQADCEAEVEKEMAGDVRAQANAAAEARAIKAVNDTNKQISEQKDKEAQSSARKRFMGPRPF